MTCIWCGKHVPSLDELEWRYVDENCMGVRLDIFHDDCQCYDEIEFDLQNLDRDALPWHFLIDLMADASAQ